MKEYFDKPDIDLTGKKVVAIFTAYNEKERVRFFLDHYRRIGVQHFFAIDNNSSDGTGDLLRDQPDVSLFFTDHSYVESKAGKLWTSELANHYCNGLWCLTLDMDEIFVFPGEGFTDLAALCGYCDDNGYEGVFTIFLDMYAKGALDEAIYDEGKSFLDVCDHFETYSYVLTQPMHFPHVGVFGGPRQRIFWEQGKRGRGPSMRKVPLVKWQPSFRYLYSTHSSVPIHLADITGALLHFKFFSSFKSFAEREYARGDRVQTRDYENYARLSREQRIVFFSKNSIRYSSSTTLVENGVMVCTVKYLNWLRARLIGDHGAKKGRIMERELRGAMNTAIGNAVLSLPLLPVIWPLLSSSADGGMIAANGSKVLGWFIDRVGRYPSRDIEAQIDGVAVASATTGFVPSANAVIHLDHKENLFEITLPDSIYQDNDSCRILLTSRQDSVPFASVLVQRSPKIDQQDDFAGSCHVRPDGLLAGCPWNQRDPTQGVALTVFIDGEFCSRIVANKYKQRLRESKIGKGDHAFYFEMPDWLEPSLPHTVDVTIHGTNIRLDGCPLKVGPRKAETARRVRNRSTAAIGQVAVRPFARIEPKTPGPTFEIFAPRRGAVYGWLADLTDPKKVFSLQIEKGNETVAEIVADQKVPAAHGVPAHLENHGFMLPWSLLCATKEKSVRASIRVVGTDEFVLQEATIYEPATHIQQTAYRGYVEAADNGCVRGWVWNPQDEDEQVAVAIFIDGLFHSKLLAADLRDDLREANIGEGHHGFRLRLPQQFRTGAPHDIDVVIEETGVPLAFASSRLRGNFIVPNAEVTGVRKLVSWFRR